MKVRIKLICFAIIAGLFLFGGSVAVFAQSAAVISGDLVNIRSGPSKNSEIVARFESGSSIDVIAIEGDWAKIKTEIVMSEFNLSGAVLNTADRKSTRLNSSH